MDARAHPWLAPPDGRAARVGRAARYRFPLLLLAAYAAIWTALAIRPWYREDWLLENVLVLVAMPLLVVTAPRLRFANGTYVALFAFFVLHAIGAHYTYSLVPYEQWSHALGLGSIGETFGWQRNHYDRLVHFAYGLLVTPAAVELFRAVAPPRGVWRALLPALFMMSHSTIYELVEWAAAVVFGGDLGVAYLGTQGDPWDAQRDMALATLGSLVTLVWLGARRRL